MQVGRNGRTGIREGLGNDIMIDDEVTRGKPTYLGMTDAWLKGRVAD